jgi:transcriptional regulator with XRE-family HTH domain
MANKIEGNQMLIDLGSKCREIRQHRGVSIAKLVKLTGISQPSITDFENGKRNVTALFLESYLKALKIEFEIVVVKSKGKKGKELRPGRKPEKGSRRSIRKKNADKLQAEQIKPAPVQATQPIDRITDKPVRYIDAIEPSFSSRPIPPEIKENPKDEESWW